MAPGEFFEVGPLGHGPVGSHTLAGGRGYHVLLLRLQRVPGFSHLALTLPGVPSGLLAQSDPFWRGALLTRYCHAEGLPV